MTKGKTEMHRVIHWRHLPTKPLAPLHLWLYLEVVRRVFDISPVWSGVLYTVLVLVGLVNTVAFFVERRCAPVWEPRDDA